MKAERDRKKQEEELERLKSLEIEGRLKEKALAEKRRQSRIERLKNIPLNLDKLNADEIEVEIMTTSRDVKKLSQIAQANKMALESAFGINKVSAMFEDAFDESEILNRAQRAVLYINCIQQSESLPYTYLVEDYNCSDPPTPYILDEPLDDLKNPSIFIF